MTKEELVNEAEESFEQYKVTDEDYVVSPYSDDMGEKMLMYNYEYYAEETYLRLYTQGYLAGAEPREKEIKSLGERCLQLQKDKGNLTDSVNNLEEKLANADYQLEGRDLEIKELKEQIEKMKSCANCKHQCSFLFQDEIDCANNGLPKWEIKEND